MEAIAYQFQNQFGSANIPPTQGRLTEREYEVLRLVAHGASNKQIARHLLISTNTVKVHLRNIFEKLEVESRTQAAVYALREGWVFTLQPATTTA